MYYSSERTGREEGRAGLSGELGGRQLSRSGGLFGGAAAAAGGGSGRGGGLLGHGKGLLAAEMVERLRNVGVLGLQATTTTQMSCMIQ